jgi:hypothetical protein
MTTKTPSTVKPAGENTLEQTAYAAVAGIPTTDPHDLDRLGYNVYLSLRDRRDPLDVAVTTARARLQISEAEAVVRIRAFLKGRGIEL